MNFKNTPKKKENLRVCRDCGLNLADDMPRGFVLENNEMYVVCISCAEGDQEGVKLGTPKNPIDFFK